MRRVTGIGGIAFKAKDPVPLRAWYRVADLAALLRTLRDEGCQVIDKNEESEFGKFGRVMDPEGNKVELWEAPAGQ